MADIKQFEVRLFQQARVHSETFPIQAADETDARNQAHEIIKTKELPEGYDIEVHDVTPVPEEEPAADDDTPEEDKALQQPDNQ